MTRLFGVIGHPVTHSLSPVMHTAAFRALRLDALYAPFDVPPRVLTPILRALILAGVEGMSVTVPLKERVVPLMDRLEGSARAIGAVNTIVVRRRRLIGYNTDGPGVVPALRELGWRAGPTRAVVLGAGGAARAVAWELMRAPGSVVTIANRRVARGRRLARWLSRACPRSRAHARALREVTLAEVELLVNATTVGMQAQDGLLIDPTGLHRGLLVYDLVYHRQTALVEAARRRGCVAANGVSMLLYQGAEALRLWLGRTPSVEVMRRALERALQQQSIWTMD